MKNFLDIGVPSINENKGSSIEQLKVVIELTSTFGMLSEGTVLVGLYFACFLKLPHLWNAYNGE